MLMPWHDGLYYGKTRGGNVHKTKGQFWAIRVQTTHGERFAEDIELPVTQSFRSVLCDTKRHAEIVITMGKFFPKGEARVVPVIVEVQEVLNSELEAEPAKLKAQ
jgi:hypothetical protein